MPILGQYKAGILAGLFVTVVLLAIGSLVGEGILRSEQEAFARGARAAIIHSHCRGSFPSLTYLHRAFRWGELRNCDDVRRVDDSVNRG